MTDVLAVTVAVAYGYLTGSIPTAYLVARWRRGIDIRRYGSGNVGASNVGRQVGKTSYVIVGLFDILIKGMGSVVTARALGLEVQLQALAALAAVVGHNWSIYLRFSGGRGLTVIGGSLLLLAWKEAVISLAVAFLGWLAFRGIALWFGIALVLLPVWALLLGEPATIILLSVALLVVSALKRLLSNPGGAQSPLPWRKVAIPRLLYDRDTWKEGDWLNRKPDDVEHKSDG
ncbi:MAG: acyl-phosphate glycerol 3-phosphate acyltransferase [Dehalococcoidia bacterium]|nr:acyl-phosphate glycerol 3-phosphate acyltransferase [Dehalococcoidia bacterium]